MMKSAHHWLGNNGARTGRFNIAGDRRVLPKAKMRSRLVVVLEVLLQDPVQVALVEYDHMIETLTPYRSNHPFHVAVLPRGLACGNDLFDSDRS